MNAVQKLRSMVDEIRKAVGPKQTNDAWGLVERLLSRAPVDAAKVAKLCASRDITSLDVMISGLENPKAPEPEPAGPEVDPEEMDKALRAFRKRLKLMRLEAESHLGSRQLTGGKKSDIDAILPPHEIPAEVWQALARAGKLKALSQGFYALP